MYRRECKPLKSNSFFLFGARGTGKSTLISQNLDPRSTLVIDLLDPEHFDHYARSPRQLIDEVAGQRSRLEWVFIDEVQKIPRLLDSVHLVMEAKETRHIRFALTGSSARKLKLAGANLLAGRAYLNELYPLTFTELGDDFNLDRVLNWGTLPHVVTAPSDEARREFLRTYTRTYLKEEVWDERLVHNLDPFRKFIEVAAQSNGTIINYSNVARQTGVDDKTVKKYFEILADTFVGFYLEAFSLSVRAQQIKSPKFYLFDLGVKRAIEGLSSVPIVAKTFAYGRAFEHLVIAECVRLNSYYRTDFKFSYLKTKDDLEIDLIIERPGRTLQVIEIKSSDHVDETDVRVLKRFRSDFSNADFVVWSMDPRAKLIDGIRAVHWQVGIEQAFKL